MPKIPTWKIVLYICLVIVIGCIILELAFGNAESDSPFETVAVFSVIVGIVVFVLNKRKNKGNDDGSSGTNKQQNSGFNNFSLSSDGIVEKASRRLALERELNKSVKIYLQVEKTFGKDISCSSRAGFERLDLFDAFHEWVEVNYDNLPDLLLKVRHNRIERDRYEMELDKLRTMRIEDDGWNASLDLSHERFCYLERKLFERNSLQFPLDFELEITKEYLSPAGNVSLKQSASFDLEELEEAVEKEKENRKPLEELRSSERIHRNIRLFYLGNINRKSNESIIHSFSPEVMEGFRNGDNKTIEDMVLSAIEDIDWPFEFERGVDISFEKEAQTLIIDFLLPDKKSIPNLKEVRKISSGEYERKPYSDSAITEIYEKFIYQTIIVVLNKVFILTQGQAWTSSLESIAFNGRVRSVDRSTGKSICPYILSVFVSRDSFNSLVLDALDPKAWFRGAKGVSAASLSDIVPITPSVRMNRTDSRFVDGYSVMDEMDDRVNLAAMDWQDFENLIRELFEREFQGPGGEVKITQASRDGGVDAIAFDPDPIRGGKIVIQAKRYTKVVDVAAVRDLYGTVINEGATKGILVTTANYGSDSYKFAQGKPLTLLNGANLLSLLEKHGHKARINIQEARETLGLSSKNENN